jgi:hypothetical protein
MKKLTEVEEQQREVERWNTEFAAAKKELEPWHKQGKRIVKRFKDEREQAQKGESRWNLFSSNVQTQMALLYGQVPKVDVGRRFGDAQDDVARVAGNILERVLNCDIEDPTDTYALALWHALEDNRLPGMGLCRIRYERQEKPVPAVPAEVDEETGEETAPAIEETLELEHESVVVEYVPWDEHLWSPCKTFDKARWWAFQNDMSRKQLVARFGDVGKRVPLNAKKGKADGDKKSTPWDRAVVWEIWDKEERKVHWYVEGFNQLLESKDDPLELAGFWPFARPMTANGTTDTLLPTPDFKLSQDLYNEIDDLSTRIKALQQAVAVRGAYDDSNKGLQRLLTETAGNELVPIKNFAAFMEKGGIAGAIAWLPLEQVVKAITELSGQRLELKAALFEVSGMADIMRGQGSGQDVTATEQRIKAKFGSARLNQIQGDFARFASDLQRLKAEVISNFYAPETLIERSNIELTPDAQYAEEAVELIKSRLGMYRVEVKPESVSLADFAEQRSEATEFVTGVSTFLQAATPLIEKVPGSGPALLELLGMVIARFNGFGQEAEAIIDKAIAQLKQQQAAAAQNPQQQPPDPKVQAEVLKQQGEREKVGLELQADLQRMGAEAQLAASQQQSQTAANVQEEQAKAVIKVQAARAMPQKPAPKGAPK